MTHEIGLSIAIVGLLISSLSNYMRANKLEKKVEALDHDISQIIDILETNVSTVEKIIKKI